MNRKQNDAATGNRRHGDRISLRRFVLWTSITALIVVAGAFLPASEAQAQRLLQISGSNRTVTVNVAIGKSADVRTDMSFNDITVGDPDVADVNVLTDRSLSILGRKNGTTRVTVYGENKKLVGVFDVEVSYDASMVAAEIGRRFGNSGLKVSSVNGKILLSGNAPDAATLDQALTLAKQFGPDVINSVSVNSPQQVMLEVRFIELARNAGRDLGVQWNVTSPNNVVANIGSRQPATGLPLSGAAGTVAAGVISGGSPFGFALGRIISSGNVTADAVINALEQKGVARSLAEPNLVALSGETASFLAGGEYPIPVSGSLGQITIDYKKYGVGLAFTPTVLSHGLINLKIEPEVSQIDTTHTVAVGANVVVPALTVRRASTMIELRDGQSFVIGGLLQSNANNSIEQLPWLGEVPVLGALFRSASYQKNETDLAIIVTPRIVRPMRPGDPLRTPHDAALPPNDADLFLLGKTEVSPAERRANALAYSGHILDLPKGGNIVSVKD